ncbi:MAG: IS1182 family transposase [Candidatus Hodarchaeales archaeon]|jgi:transposase
MSYRGGQRRQMMLFPPSIDEYVSADDPVRAYDAFVEALDFNELGIMIDYNKVGNPQYDPKAMIKLLVYGYSYGIRSSRKLERATYHNVAFIWLTGGLRPDHKTIAKFRRDNKEALKNILKQCARLCIKLNLIEGNTLFVDSTRIRANASINSAWSREKCEEYFKKIDGRIEEILQQCDEMDKQEKSLNSLVKLKGKLRDKVALRDRVVEILKELQTEEKRSINTTDPDCVRIKGRQGTHAGYSSHIVVDKKHGLIVNSDVVSENNDVNQFSNQINQANELVEGRCRVACGDSGYANTSNLQEIVEKEITVVVPSQREASKKALGEFSKEHFRYDPERDCYICPEDQLLEYKRYDKIKKHREYRITKIKICRSCRRFGECTRSKNHGRKVIRLANEEVKEKIQRYYKSKEGQSVYKLRQQKVELVFGHIKRNLNAGAFLLRGISGVKAEMSLLSSCFNIARMITLLGVPELISKLIRLG